MLALPLQGNCRLPPDAEAYVSVASCSCDVELQQRAYELLALLNSPREVSPAGPALWVAGMVLCRS